jgi:hypothetical protein
MRERDRGREREREREGERERGRERERERDRVNARRKLSNSGFCEMCISSIPPLNFLISYNFSPLQCPCCIILPTTTLLSILFYLYPLTLFYLPLLSSPSCSTSIRSLCSTYYYSPLHPVLPLSAHSVLPTTPLLSILFYLYPLTHLDTSHTC